MMLASLTESPAATRWLLLKPSLAGTKCAALALPAIDGIAMLGLGL
jgi:hypothetical protein